MFDNFDVLPLTDRDDKMIAGADVHIPDCLTIYSEFNVVWRVLKCVFA